MNRLCPIDLAKMTRTCKFFHHYINTHKIDNKLVWKKDVDLAIYMQCSLTEAMKDAPKAIQEFFNETRRAKIPFINDVRDEKKYPATENYTKELLTLLPKFEVYKTPLLLAQDAHDRWMFLIRIRAEERKRDGILVIYQSCSLRSWRDNLFGVGGTNIFCSGKINSIDWTNFFDKGQLICADPDEEKQITISIWDPK